MAIDSTPIRMTLGPVAELDRLGDEIAELSAHLEAASARLLDLIREFDARGGWCNGFRSCADWLGWRVGLDLGTAREKVRVARALATLPLLAQALARGELSYAKVRALTRVATPETEARLLGVGRGGTAAHVERIVRGWRYMDRKAEARETKRQHASRALHVHQDEDGTVVLRGRLEPEVGALFMKALAAARETLYQRGRGERAVTRFNDPSADPSAERPTMAQQQADALALVAEAALDHGLDPGAPGERYQVVVHVDAAALADPDQPGQSVARGRGARSAREPLMWRSPLPVVLKRSTIARGGWSRGRSRYWCRLEPGAEPDPGRCEVPASCRRSTRCERASGNSSRINAPGPPERRPPWTSCMPGVQASTCTRRRWWRVCGSRASQPDARPRGDANLYDHAAGAAGPGRLAGRPWGDPLAMESTGVYWRPVLCRPGGHGGGAAV